MQIPTIIKEENISNYFDIASTIAPPAESKVLKIQDTLYTSALAQIKNEGFPLGEHQNNPSILEFTEKGIPENQPKLIFYTGQRIVLENIKYTSHPIGLMDSSKNGNRSDCPY